MLNDIKLAPCLPLPIRVCFFQIAEFYLCPQEPSIIRFVAWVERKTNASVKLNLQNEVTIFNTKFHGREELRPPTHATILQATFKHLQNQTNATANTSTILQEVQTIDTRVLLSQETENQVHFIEHIVSLPLKLNLFFSSSSPSQLNSLTAQQTDNLSADGIW